MRRARFDRSLLDRRELLVLASGALLFVPGARSAWAWPWLWLVPGWFFARRVLGVRGGFLLATLSLVASIAFASLVCLPLTIVAAGPRPWIVFVSVALFALGCAVFGRPREERALAPVEAPPPLAWVVVAAFVALRVALAIAEHGRPPSNPDAWYLHAVVRELASGFPPSNPIAATTILKQPWGYWMLYALTHVASGIEVATTLQIASLVLALAFASILYVLVTGMCGDRRAGGFAVALAFGAAELLWLEELVRPATERLMWDVQGVTSFAMNVVDGFYDLPVLVLAIAVLHFVASGRPALAAVFVAVAPYFHPVHAAVLFATLAFALGPDAARRRLTRAHAWLLVAPLPFYVLFVLVYAHGMPAHPPFVPRLAGIDARATRYLRWAGLLVPFAVAGAFAIRSRGRALLVALFATTSTLWLFTFAANYHWAADLLSVALVALGGAALGALVERHGRLGQALALGIVVAVIAAADYPRRLRPVTDRRTSDERAAGRWIQESTSPRAIFAVDHESMPAVATALGLGERRVFLGPTYQLVNTATAAEATARARESAAILHAPCEAPGHHVDFVLLERRSIDSTAMAAWQARSAPVYENTAVRIYAAAALACP